MPRSSKPTSGIKCGAREQNKNTPWTHVEKEFPNERELGGIIHGLAGRLYVMNKGRLVHKSTTRALWAS